MTVVLTLSEPAARPPLHPPAGRLQLYASLAAAGFALSAVPPAIGATLAEAPVAILAAESVYGDIASQVGGPAVAVSSILRNPHADPHTYEPAPSAARAVAAARIVIENGLGYDPWMDRLLAASPAPGRRVISLATLLHAPPGANDHLWFDPAAMPALQSALCSTLAGMVPDPAALAQRCAATAASLKTLRAGVAEFRATFAGTRVAATEPVMGNLLSALGLTDSNGRFETSVMNGTEPRASDTARLEDELRGHAVALLIANAQATNDAAERLKTVASQSGVQVLTVSETLPPGQTYQAWMESTLRALATALHSAKPSASSRMAGPSKDAAPAPANKPVAPQ